MEGSVAINVEENLLRRKDRDHKVNETMNHELYTYAKKDHIDELTHSLQQHQSKEQAPLSTIFEAVTPSGNSLLHVAASSGSKKVTNYLAREFPSLIPKENYQGDTALHLAAREQKLSTVEILVKANASLLRMANKKGNTPLHDAVINGHNNLARHLVSEDREVAYNYYNKAGKSPLYLAVEKGTVAENGDGILDHVLEAIEDGNSNYPNKEDGDSHSKLQPEAKSPVHAAIELHNKEKLEKLATKFPELLRYKDKELRNPLHFASSLGYLEGVQFLLEKYRAGATERDQEGNLPIHIASKSGHVSVMDELLKQWPDKMEFLNGKGRNILHVAAEHGQEKVVNYILKNIPSKLPKELLNETDEDGNTPLHLAAKHGKSFVVYHLVRDKRVGTEIVNNENLTSYGIAEDQSKAAVMEYEKSDKMDKLADAQKQNETADSNSYKRLDFYEVMRTLSIFFFHASPKKSLFEYFAVPTKYPKKEEIKSKIENLLVVATLVASVTFAGVIQLPNLADEGSDGEFERSFGFGPFLLNIYLIIVIWALNCSVAAAIILLWTQLNDIKFAPYAVWISSKLVGGSIYSMCLAFFLGAGIALIEYFLYINWWLAVLAVLVAAFFFVIQTLLYLQWWLPPSINQIVEGILSHIFYYLSFSIIRVLKRLADKFCGQEKKKKTKESNN